MVVGEQRWRELRWKRGRRHGQGHRGPRDEDRIYGCEQTRDGRVDWKVDAGEIIHLPVPLPVISWVNISGFQLRTEREYAGSFRSNVSREVEDKFEEWVKHLPKTLWELGAANLEATEVRSHPRCFSPR